jgi:choline dehydrogenase
VSNDTNIYPIVDPAWLKDPRDAEMAVAAFKRMRQMFATKAIQPILVGPEAYPGPGVAEDEAILQNIRRSTTSLYHASGSNRMGRVDDAMAVVDSQGKSSSTATYHQAGFD